MIYKPDFLIAGAGIMGLTLALEIRRQFPNASIVIIEKEKKIASHASGRNSGVLHAGFYYTSDSLKARFCRDGNLVMTDYCLSRGLRINRCGKLVVTKNELELVSLEILRKRGELNGIELHEITAAQARKIEPRIRTCVKALWSPKTSSISPPEVMNSLLEDAKKAFITVLTNEPFKTGSPQNIFTHSHQFAPGFFINAAGLYADQIARCFGFAKDLKIIPFKGLYLYSNETPGSLQTNVYPVPDLKYPFLGVHYTVDVGGKIKIGPTAIPAFWRENYSGLHGFNLAELSEIVRLETELMLSPDPGFRTLAVTELKKMSKQTLTELASGLISGVRQEDYTKWGRPGIRAQLFDTVKKRLVMDFCVQGDRSSFHILNAVSPAFTASFPFARYCVQKIINSTSTVQQRG